MNTENSEKIQVVVEDSTIRFPSKTLLDKIVDYINFDSSNKYTLVFSHAIINSRSSGAVNRNGASASSHKSSIHSANGHRIRTSNSNNELEREDSSLIAKQIVPGKRKKSSSAHLADSSTKDLIYESQTNLNNENNSEVIDQVLTKV